MKSASDVVSEFGLSKARTKKSSKKSGAIVVEREMSFLEKLQHCSPDELLDDRQQYDRAYRMFKGEFD